MPLSQFQTDFGPFLFIVLVTNLPKLNNITMNTVPGDFLNDEIFAQAVTATIILRGEIFFKKG